MTPAHEAVEHGDLLRLRDLLDGGVDVEEIEGGLTLLRHAIDVELDMFKAESRYRSTSRPTCSLGAPIHSPRPLHLVDRHFTWRDWVDTGSRLR